MGLRGELFSTKVALQNRTYFFNVKENRLGDLYLNIVESKNRDEGGFERQSVILFAEDLQDFLQGFDESLRVLEKASREKRRGKTGPSRDSEGEDRPRSRNSSSGDREYRKSRDYGKSDDSRRPRRSDKPRGVRTEWNSEKKSDKPRGSFRSSREGGFARETGFGRNSFGSSFDRSENPRKRYENKDRERRPSSHRAEDKRDSPLRKKRVVIKKR